MITQPTWLDRSEFPFTSRTFSHSHGDLHYVDEGAGPIALFVHGTPDWSFGFRKLIKQLGPTHRCIALDHLGFGLSDKPKHADLSVEAHAQRLQDFVDHLELKNIILIVTDFGGGIGQAHALDHAENVKGIVLYNTWLWDLMPDKRFYRPAVMMNSAFGRFLYLHLGFSVNVMMPSGYGDRKKLTKAIHAHFKNALPDAVARISTFALLKEIRIAGQFWNTQWSQVDRLRDIPTALCWGLKDRFFPPDMLEHWKRALPNARVQIIPEVGHFVHEESADELVRAIRSLNLH